MLFGCVKVSTKTKNPDLQIDALLKEAVNEKNVYRDVSSGAKAERHDLDLMISRLGDGDTVIVWKLDRIARSISHLLKLVDRFEKLGVKFRSINDPFMDTSSAHGKFVITLFGAVAQLERQEKGHPVGGDARELRRIRQFYLCFQIRDTVCPELSWSHYRLLIRIENERTRQFYLNEFIGQHWSVRKLDRNISSQYYQRNLAKGTGAFYRKRSLTLFIAGTKGSIASKKLNMPTLNRIGKDIKNVYLQFPEYRKK